MGDEEGSVDGYGGTALFVFIPTLFCRLSLI